MTAVQLLIERLTEVEKMKIRMSESDDALIARYYDFRPELSGGAFHGGTVEDGIEEMRQVRDTVVSNFIERSKAESFPRGWAF